MITNHAPDIKAIPKPDIKGRAPKVLLLYAFTGNRNNSPPLSLAMIGAVLREKGCEVRAVDMAAGLVDDGKSRALSALDDMKPDTVAMSLIVGNARETYHFIKEHLEHRGLPIIAGGPHATILPNEALEHGVHIVVRGEGEATIAELVEWLKDNKELSDIDGISYRTEDGTIKCNPDRALIADLDTLPLPAHDLFDPKDYFSRPEDAVIAGKLLSSRGCPNKCSFCSNPVFGRNFRYRSPDAVIAEMKMLQERYGINQFEFLDDAFTANRKRIMELSESLRKVTDYTFSCVTRLDNLDNETAPALRAAGLFKAHIGVESGRPDTLKRIHKNINLDILIPTLKLLKKNGIESYLFFMHGFPWESAEEMRETNQLIEKLKPLATLFSEGGVVNPYPGTEIYEEYHDTVGFTDWWLTGWTPPDWEELHDLQPYYFFQYDEEQKAVIREALDMVFEHNRGAHLEGVKENIQNLLMEIERLKGIIGELENDVRDRDSQLREIWDRSLVEKLKRIFR